jgi:hypothetical protein
MTSHGWRRLLTGTLALLALYSGGGCMSFGRPVAPPRPEVCACCQTTPACCRECVHIYMINGLTIIPHVYGSLNGIEGYIESLGFCKPHTATHYWQWQFEKEIRRVHQQDPGAHFVLVGYSMGGGVVHAMAQNLAADGVRIDLVFYIDPQSVTEDLTAHPRTTLRVVNVTSDGPLLRGLPLDGACNEHVSGVWHLGVPRDARTLEFLARELAAVATALPPPEPACAPEPPR